jgi:predicted transcriptional regulator
MDRVTVSVKMDADLAAQIDHFARENNLQKAELFEQALRLSKRLLESKEIFSWVQKVAEINRMTHEEIIIALLQMERLTYPRGLKIIALSPKSKADEEILAKLRLKYEETKSRLPFDVWLTDSFGVSENIITDDFFTDADFEGNPRSNGA